MAEKTVIIYEGETYTRRNDKWVDAHNFVVHEGLQRDLNKEYVKQLDPALLSLEVCIEQGDKFKKSGSTGLALKFYEAAVEKADSRTMAYILPRITSCYRKSGRPQKAIDILTYASKTFGKSMITPVLLTSAAAAYCDIEDYERAKRCCDRAYAESNGMHSDELSLVYKRIKKATVE